MFMSVIKIIAILVKISIFRHSNICTQSTVSMCIPDTLYRVEFPTHITDHGRMNMLVTWIVDNPQESSEEDARARREEV